MAVPSSAARRALPGAAARPRIGSRAYWSNLRYYVFGRLVPMLLFGWLGWKQLSGVPSSLSGAGVGAVLNVLPVALYAVFCTIPVAIYITRPRPSARDGRLVARAAAFGGTCVQLFVGAVIPTHVVHRFYNSPAWLDVVSVLMTIVAYAFAIWALSYLRRSLSIVPEARRLTTGGPYRLVRHPMYAAEITAAVALALTAGRLIPFASVAVFILLQIARTRFEERLLSTSFDEYADYRRRTHRLIPFVV